MKKKIILITVIISFIGIMLILNNILKKENEKNFSYENTTKNENVIIKVDSTNFQEKILDNENIVLIDFYADWCEPCKVFSKILERVAVENPDAQIVKINIDEETDLATQYNIISIPTLVVVKNGEEINRFVGVITKSKVEKLIK